MEADDVVERADEPADCLGLTRAHSQAHCLSSRRDGHRAWTLDPAVVLVAGIAASYAWCLRGTSCGVSRAQSVCFATGLALWTLAVTSPLAAYAPLLFWVRALQVLVLMFVVPLLLAAGAPLTAVRAVFGERVDAMLATRTAKVLVSPALTSVLMLATPWLLYMTPWYVASLVQPVLGIVTRMALVAIGFAYFYARLQVDPVPRRYTPLLSVGISIVESLADGLLGLVLWLGPLIAVDYYVGLHRTFGPSLRDDQTFGAGILWILGDVVGIPFVVLLMRALGSDERTHAAVVDAGLDAKDDDAAGGLWWEQDPELRERFRR